MKNILYWYIRWRSNGTGHIKPPLGYHPVYLPRPVWWITVYKIKYYTWVVEKYCFNLLKKGVKYNA